MKLAKAMLLGCVVVGMTTAAAAFQEQQGSAVAPAQQQPAPSSASQKPAADFSTPDAGKGAGGTEVRIPGLGKLGVLPKMDFGLELLYGAAEGKAPETRPDQADEDGLRIQGTVKHRF